MRRSFIVIIIFILAVATGYFYFSKNEINFSKDTQLYKAVPVTAPLFIEFNSLKSLPH